MPTPGKLRRRYGKAMMKKLAAGEGLVDERETQRFQQQAQQAAESQLGAQQMQLNQMAQGAGPMAQAPLLEAQQQLGDKAVEAGVLASSGAQQYAAAQEAQRKAQAVALAGQLGQETSDKAKYAIGTAMQLGQMALGQANTQKAMQMYEENQDAALLGLMG